jgi:phosphomannomutase
MVYVFDVDGTLTLSRQTIDLNFKKFFIDFISKKQVYLASGSDLSKTIEQLGTDICSNVSGIFSCAGNVFYKNGIEIYRNDFELTNKEYNTLESELLASQFYLRTGQHIEKRIGLVNFSIVGRLANLLQRKEYVEWDTKYNERFRIAEKLNQKFNRLHCGIAGETGIDIYLRGKDKRQVADHIPRPFTFFGDRCEPGGNDFPLAKISDKCYHVKNWEETWSILSKGE